MCIKLLTFHENAFHKKTMKFNNVLLSTEINENYRLTFNCMEILNSYYLVTKFLGNEISSTELRHPPPPPPPPPPLHVMPVYSYQIYIFAMPTTLPTIYLGSNIHCDVYHVHLLASWMNSNITSLSHFTCFMFKATIYNQVRGCQRVHSRPKQIKSRKTFT